HRTLDHRRDDLQVRGVERQRQVDFAAGGHDVGGKALVIFDVTGGQTFDLLALELVEQVARVLAEGVDQNVEATTVGHADDDFLGAVGATALDDLVHQRNQAFATFQTKAFGTRVFGSQVLFQAFGGGQTLKQMPAHVGGERRTSAHAFQTLLEPAALFGIDDMGELGADGTAIGLLQRVDDLAQARLFLADHQPAGTEGGVQVGVGKTVMMDGQVGRKRTLPEAERVEGG